MDELHSILATHHSKNRLNKKKKVGPEGNDKSGPTTSEIPDVFFDTILVHFKLGRMEIMVLMYLYRQVWCRPNLYQNYGISQILSHTEIGKNLNLSIDEVYAALRKLESLNFIETIRSGQYFVRRYFSEDLDKEYGQNYDDF